MYFSRGTHRKESDTFMAFSGSPPPPPFSTDNDQNHGKEVPVEPGDSSFSGSYDWMEKRNGGVRKGGQMLNGGFQRSSAHPPESWDRRVIDQDGFKRYSSPPLPSLDDSSIRGPTITR